MSAQRDPNKVAVMCYVPIDIVSKIRTLIEGQTIPNKVCKGRIVRKPYRSMGVSNYIIKLAEEAVRDVVPNQREQKWKKKTLRKNIERRKLVDKNIVEKHKK